MIRMRMTTLVATAAALAALPALAGVTVTYEVAAAPTYSTTLNFDEPGGPTGAVPANAWQGSHGVTSLVSGVGDIGVGDLATILGLPWLGTGNAAEAPFGVFMNFDNDVTEFSAQIWDTSGPASPFGGGAAVFLFNDGAHVPGQDDFTPSFFFSPTFSAVGPTWLNITTDSGTVFDDIRVLGFGFSPVTYMDNASWNVVPEPATLALLGFGGLAVMRRRR